MLHDGRKLMLKTDKAVAVYVVSQDDGWGLVVVAENEAGYHPTDLDTFRTEVEAKAAADRWNQQLGLTPERATLIVASSMRAEHRPSGGEVVRVQGKAKKRLDPDPQVTPQLALTLTREALSQLKMAARNLRVVGAANTLERVKLAISSCKGAVRNQRYRVQDAYQEGVDRLEGRS